MVWSQVLSGQESQKQTEIWEHEDVAEAFWKGENRRAEGEFFVVFLCLPS